jgi:hypothetical protein
MHKSLNSFFKPFFGRFSRIFDILTAHQIFLDLKLGNIYIFDVIMSKIKRNGPKKGLL